MHDIEDIIKANNDVPAYRAGRDAATGGRLSRIPPSDRPRPITVPLHVFWRGVNYLPGVAGAVGFSQVYRTTLDFPAHADCLSAPAKYTKGLAVLCEDKELGSKVYDKVEILFCIEGGIIHAITPCTDEDLASLAEIGRAA